jgi:hypothetical protein
MREERGMLKFVARGKRTLIGLGLSAINLERLRKGQPIAVDLEKLGIPLEADVVIFFGETEQMMVEELQNLGLIKDNVTIQKDSNGH